MARVLHRATVHHRAAVLHRVAANSLRNHGRDPASKTNNKDNRAATASGHRAENTKKKKSTKCMSLFGAGMPHPKERIGFNLTYKKHVPQNYQKGGVLGSAQNWVGGSSSVCVGMHVCIRSHWDFVPFQAAESRGMESQVYVFLNGDTQAGAFFIKVCRV